MASPVRMGFGCLSARLLAAAAAGTVMLAVACASAPTGPAAPPPDSDEAAPDIAAALSTTIAPAAPEPAPETTAAPDTETPIATDTPDTAGPVATSSTDLADTPDSTEPVATSSTDLADTPDSTEPALAELPERSGWSIQFGTDRPDTTFGVSAGPDGDIVVAAATEGSLGGDNQGQRDAYLARYSGRGELLWARQTGGPQNDSPLGVSVAPDSSIYMGGFTDGDFASPNHGSADVWLTRYDADGNELWRRQFGGPAWDRGFDVTAFDGGAYVTGYTASPLDPDTNMGGFDGFAARYDAHGNQEWVRQFGTDATDWGQGSALAPDGGLYVTGYSEGGLDGANAGDKDLFAVRLRPDGSLVWATQLGSAALDWTQGVGTGPDGGMLMAGSTEGSFAADHAGERDMLVVLLDADGNERWRWQAGTDQMDTAFEVRQTGQFIVVTGSTAGSMGGAGSALGDRDAVLVWLDLTGNLVEVEQFGTDAVDDATGLDVAADGTVVWSGYTFGAFGTDSVGEADLLVGLQAMGR